MPANVEQQLSSHDATCEIGSLIKALKFQGRVLHRRCEEAIETVQTIQEDMPTLRASVLQKMTRAA